MQLPRLAIVDLETTGADPSRDRITEIAILTTEGDQLVEQWSTLVNPGMPIPERIQAFTGISDAMVADAPRFEDIAAQVRARLTDVLFVAHNARFDYNFLVSSYERLGELFASQVLCSVKLSRALDPAFARHGLDAIIERGAYHIESRHRATDDATIVWRFILDSLKRHELPHFEQCWSRALSGTSVPRLPAGNLEALPLSHGVFVFYGSAGQVLHVGRARNLRSQVLGVFTGARGDAKTKRLAAQVDHVETHLCAGEIGAQLLELQISRQLLKPKKAGSAFAWRWQRDAARGPVLVLETLTGSDPHTWRDCYGSFRGDNEARTVLRELARRHRLCAARIGLEHVEGPCSGLGLERCAGVCVGKEAQVSHDVRLAGALSALIAHHWPFNDVVTIREYDPDTDMAATHVFSHWCYLGTARDEAELGNLMSMARRYDPEIHRLLQRWIASPELRSRMQSLARVSNVITDI